MTNQSRTSVLQQQAQAIQIHKPPNKVKILGLNKQLLDAALSFPESRQSVAGLMIGVRVNQDADAEAYAASIRTMEDLVRRGASINESGALQSVVANKENMMVVKILLRLGGDVNHRDELGTTPLHVAAGCQRYKAVEYLLSVGADSTATNLDGEMPLKCLQSATRNHGDFDAAFGLGSMPVREIDVVPKLRCLQALVPQATRPLLIDVWMSPRMKKMLIITAEHDMDQILNDNDVHFTRFQPTPISECCACFGISRIDYIPPAVLSSPENRNGLYKSFNDGWGFVWMAIQAVLKDGCTPSHYSPR